ncbi:olfactory receptor 14A16-like [Elgaria multicarinata webbii]|uniref:olfactory receptor 14A16-like n=1 Tax=Elgaria multicarinata webbii TaxID=159646 RepID=UPI002FCCCF8A
MAHNLYIAICNSLWYETIMNKMECVKMVACIWISGILFSAIHTATTFAILLCSNVLDQYFCEIPQILKLSCTDLYLAEIHLLFVSVIVVLGCFIFIIVTYVQIFTTVLRMPSVQGRQKAFATCLPHLIVVSMSIYTAIFAYLIPSSNSPSDLGSIFAVIYSVIPPIDL